MSATAPPSAQPRVRPEIGLLLSLCRRELTPAEVEFCRTFLREHRDGFHWGLFVDQAGRHKVLPLVGYHIAHHRLHHSDDGPPLIPYYDMYAGVYLGNQRRNAALAAEFGGVLRDLTAAGIPYAVRKGPVVVDTLYGDPGLRRMNDLDILVERRDAERVGQVLHNRGYAQGRLSADRSSVTPFDRATRAFWRMNVNNELPYVKAADDLAADFCTVDVCVDLLQRRAPGHIPVAGLLERRIPVPLLGESSFALSPEDQFIDLCLHFHKEATARYYIEAGADLHLQKFLDVALACARATRERRWEAIEGRAREYGVEKGVFFAMHHAAVLYPDHVPARQLDALRPDDTGLLDEYGELDGRTERWRAPLLERLFQLDRRALLQGASGVPHA